MTTRKIYTVIGLMSGTSMDGIDAALIRTDGDGHIDVLGAHSTPYTPAFREQIRGLLGTKNTTSAPYIALERAITEQHAKTVKSILNKHNLSADQVDLIGFHGQTLFHDAERAVTVQIGDGALLAGLCGIDVVNDFRSADVSAGGQGAPFLPLYHRALVRNAHMERPVAFLNLGGVANVTWIGEGEDILAFDTGPASAFIDDWVQEYCNVPYDEDGNIAAKGQADKNRITRMMDHAYFAQKPPKSLDRYSFDILPFCDGLSPEDGAATLTAFSVQSIVASMDHMAVPPKRWLVTGGGRNNKTLMAGLERALNVPVEPTENYGWDGDMLEAEGFAYLAVRSALGEPLSVPGTTGVSKPMTGGVLHKARTEKIHQTA